MIGADGTGSLGIGTHCAGWQLDGCLCGDEGEDGQCCPKEGGAHDGWRWRCMTFVLVMTGCNGLVNRVKRKQVIVDELFYR